MVLVALDATWAQRVEVDMTSCRAMYDVLQEMKEVGSRASIAIRLDSLLHTRPYEVMFRHYNRSWRPHFLPRDVFKRMIMSLRFPDLYSPGENQCADEMLPLWKRHYDDLESFRRNVMQLERSDLRVMFNDAARLAQDWLPPGWHIPDSYVVIQPSGRSPGFAIGDAHGYDYFQLPRNSAGEIEWNHLVSTIAHEYHHIGLNAGLSAAPPLSGMTSSDSLAYEFLSLFVGEGTATKFIGNVAGGFVPVADSSRASPLYDSDLMLIWNKYSADEDTLFIRLVSTFERAFSGSMTADEFEKEKSGYWLAGSLAPIYFVGSELFGAIYHGLGKGGVYEAMRDHRKLFSLYNMAIEKRPDILGKCLKIPPLVVRHALSIARGAE